MKTFFTADLHLGHGNIIKYCQRPFMTAEETAQTKADPLTRDVGVDACDYKPVGFEELHAWMQPRVRAFEERKAKFIAGDNVEFVE
jgi:calcineurin-like phosphoesterase family protein